jgi:transcription elongation factor S-II
MRRVENPSEFRKNVRAELFKIIPQTRQVKNLEKGLFNYCIVEADARNIVKKWDNVYFTHLYIDRWRTIMTNLKSQSLRDKILSKKIRAHKVALMTHQEMSPERWIKLIDDKKARDENRYAPRLDANTDNFTCYKCKSKRCSYYQLQTRSADEPMTTFVTCIDCGNRWKC